MSGDTSYPAMPIDGRRTLTNTYLTSKITKEKNIPHVIGQRLSDSQDGGHDVEVAY